MPKHMTAIQSRGLLFMIMAIFSLLACQQEVDDGGFNPGGGGSAGDAVMVIAGVRGVVVDENNQPVQGATVTSGLNSTTTDRYGVFRFRNISLSRNNGYLQVKKPGYFTGHRSFVTTEGRIHNVRIRLLRRTTTGTFTAATGGTVSLPSGAKLVMPADAVTDAGGGAYAGSVNIDMTWIDPTAPNLPEIIVGDLRGLTTAGEERGLETFGMIGVEMTGAGGQPLKIAAGKKAELTFPVPAALAAHAPATIDLWHFDETKGRWMQEGTATRNGNNYIAEVSHFSFWNCDAPFPLVNLCMTLVNAANSTPLVNVQVRIKRANGSYGYGWTDSLGNLCGKVPKNEALTLEVLDQCNNIAFSTAIGPFSSNTTLGTIAVNLPATNTLIITGTLTDCANANVTNGAVIIYTSGTYSYTVPVTNGTFSVTIVRCSNTTLNFSVLGVDYNTLQQSTMASGSGTTGTVNMGTVQACGISAEQFAEFIIEGVPYNFVAPPDHFSCFDSTGTWGTYTSLTNAWGFKGAGTTNSGSFSFGFPNNGVPGTFPLQQGMIQYPPSLQVSQFINPNPVVTITVFGATGNFIEGNFSEIMNVSGTPKNVMCTFRIRRN